MPGKKDATARTRGTTLRGLGFALAIALGAVAVWLVVTGTTQKRIELGVLAGLWGLLLGTFAMFGARRLPAPAGETDLQTRQLDELAAHREALTAEIELRSSVGLERAADAEQRKAFESGLQAMLQREVGEIRGAVSGEIASLRAEVAGLRAEILEKVGGQLRLERIETTRVIGSDLEALQHEVRALKTASFTDDPPPPRRDPVPEPRRTVVEPARVRPVSRESAQVEADVQPAVAPPTFSQPPTFAQAPAPPPTPSAPPAAPSPTPAAVPTPAPVSPAAPTPAPPPAPQPDDDPLASLPRITPFTAFELDPIDSEPVEDDYSGRRRRRDARHVEEAPTRSRHSRQSAPAPGPNGGRRRAADPDDPPPPLNSGVGAAHAGPDGARHGAGRHTDPDATEQSGNGNHANGSHANGSHANGNHANGNHANGNRHEADDYETDDYEGGVDLLSRLLSRDSNR